MSTAVEAEIRELAARAEAIVNRADEDGGRGLTDGENTEVMNIVETLGAKAKALKDKKAVRDAVSGFTNIGYDPTPKATVSNYRPMVQQTAGGMFVASAEYADLLNSRGADANPWHKRRVQADPVGMGGSLMAPKGSNLSVVRNALVTGTSPEAGGSGSQSGVLINPQLEGLIAPTYARELTVRDLLTTVPISGDTIDYVRVASVTNNAAVVPEATSSARRQDDGDPGPGVSGNPGGYKPESALTFSEQREHAVTIAHTMPVTKKALADAPQIRVIIDTFLRYGLEEKVEDMIVAGNGTAGVFKGFLSGAQASAGVQTLAGDSGDDVLTKALKAKTASRLARGGAPTAYLMNPLTWQNYQLTRDGEDRFRGSGPFGAEQGPTLWSLPVVLSEAMPSDKVITGNFRQAVYYDRQQASVTATDSHEDFFVRNLVMILAEETAGFAILHPSSFVKFDAIDNPES